MIGSTHHVLDVMATNVLLQSWTPCSESRFAGMATSPGSVEIGMSTTSIGDINRSYGCLTSPEVRQAIVGLHNTNSTLYEQLS
jgi:hypothetical protein